MLNNTITVKISKRPNNMQKLVNHLAKSVRCPQLSDGPIPPSPGPIFPMAEAAAVKDVIKSRPVVDKIIAVRINIKR